MSQEQPQRPQANQFPEQQTIKPRDAALMQTTENQASGQTQKRSSAAALTQAKDNQALDTGLVMDKNAITIGEALEVSALTRAGDKPLDQSDAAAIQAAEMRATGKNQTQQGGLGAMAQSAASRNSRTMPLQNTTLADVVTGAREKLGADKAVTREDAEGVIGAELRNKDNTKTTPGGVAGSMAAAATLNQKTKSG
ncbi:late embryogenesis abundant protein D-34-like isoform X2 [Vicia villosa]|uniref:late embryogenesis abundant protein D-34-like isoform X2 n=1 Tax=Vicia villosa TaxID=3911 RepID=UPI00273B3C31|nr:late embryogenesis abundant protein D-34-like isoform X2 [Vicia villosa]